MVCSVGAGRMKALARLLEAASFTEIVPHADVTKQRLSTVDIVRELGVADDANLLYEGDLHVFGLNPMDDPLYLVSCNFCKKTINASQYASHAELCKYLGFQKAYAGIEDCGMHKKTTCKKRIKLSRFLPEIWTKLESTTFDDSVASKSYQDDHIGAVSSLSTLTDDSLDGVRKVDVSSVHFGFEDLSTAAVCHLKHCKLTEARIMANSGEQETRDSKWSRYQDSHTYRGCSEAAIAGYGQRRREPLVYQKTNNFPNSSLQNDVPAPLATKMYYTQQSNHLRSALAVMFHKASDNGSTSGVVSSETLEGNLTSPQTYPTSAQQGNEFCEPAPPIVMA